MIRNIAVMAHVDTGKTTLTEQMLRHCGAIRMVGSVDVGTAHTDRLEVERRRGISVHAACVPMRWRDTDINLIDTPGHTISAEVERSCGRWTVRYCLLAPWTACSRRRNFFKPCASSACLWSFFSTRPTGRARM